MRARSIAGAALLSVLSVAATARAAEPPPYKSPWEGFGVGSYVQFQTTMKMTGAGLPPMPEEATETRETVVEVTDAAHTITRETKTSAGWTKTDEIRIPRKLPTREKPAGGTPDSEIEDLGTEKLTVEGKTIECKKVRTHYANTTSTTWVSKAHGVLKLESESDAGGGRTIDTRTVTALAKKVKLAGKELVCRETRTFTKMDLPGVPAGAAGDGTTGVELESDSVPGRRARMETSGRKGPLTMSTVRELVAFEAKPQ